MILYDSLSYRDCAWSFCCENDLLVAFMPADLPPPRKACREGSGFQSTAEHHALRAGRADGLWLCVMREAVNHPHGRSLAVSAVLAGGKA